MSGTRGEFGRLRYLRPGTEVPARCPAGHQLGVAGPNNGWSHLLRRHEYCCDLCRELGSTRWSWCPVDVTEQHTQEAAPHTGLALVQVPPPRWAGSGQLRLQLGEGTGTPAVLGTATLALCSVDRRAVLQAVEVNERWRRRGVGRVLLAAAAALGTGYSWSTRPIPRDLAARAFWARVGPADWPAPPAYCSHQLARGPIAEEPG
ncbi:hypothetical protein L3Q67_45300 (plasmid) [Saccharothrix sp. AJ9571]|nr:hypothetical protein L3Q67_45300 [Saccharothrix sp. AJ9571]